MSNEQTDASKLVTGQTVSVSPDGGTSNEPFPKPDVEYHFCVDVTNAGNLPSGPFFVQFRLTGDQDAPEELNLPKELNFAQDAGLDSGASVKAVVHFGTFPNKSVLYHLNACIFSSSAPEQPINCAGQFDFTVNTE
jgi:hypothetical protein